MNLVQDGFRRFALGVGVEIQNDAVPQHGGRHLLHVFHAQMEAAAHQREHAAAFHQRLRAARRTAVADVLVGDSVSHRGPGLRGHHQVDGVILHVRRNQHLLRYRTQFGNLLAVHDRPQIDFFLLHGALDDAAQIVARRIGDQNLHQEAVELRFRQRIGAFHFDGILRGHHQERRFQLMGGGAAGDGALLHGFEQRGLRFGRGAIDFVGQHQVRENRSGLEAQRLVPAVVGFDDHAADDVGGHQVGRELDARILEVQDARQRAQQGGLAQARNAFEQHVSAGEQADQNAVDDVVLADDDFRDFIAHLSE